MSDRGDRDYRKRDERSRGAAYYDRDKRAGVGMRTGDSYRSRDADRYDHRRDSPPRHSSTSYGDRRGDDPRSNHRFTSGGQPRPPTSDYRASDPKPVQPKSRFTVAPTAQRLPTTQNNLEVDAIEPHELMNPNMDPSEMVQLEKEWDRAWANYDYIFIQNKKPIRRRHRNKWTDAPPEESTNLRRHEQGNILVEQPRVDASHGEYDANFRAVIDANQIKKKIYIPQNNGVNYIGMIIGPKGLYQKRLEEETGCKILIRGKGSQKTGSAPQPDDDDEQHVLLISDTAQSMQKAQIAIERIITADEKTREKIKQEQFVVAQQLNKSSTAMQVQNADCQLDDSMMTPYGPPSQYAYIIPVPNDIVGLIIGQQGQQIRKLQVDSGAKIQVAKEPIKGANTRYVFVEGEHDKYLLAKDAIEEIIRENRKANDPIIHIGERSPFGQPDRTIEVPGKYVGLIIGKSGENLKQISAATNTKIFMPQKSMGNDVTGVRIVEIVSENPQDCEEAERRIRAMIEEQQDKTKQNFGKNPYGTGYVMYQRQQGNKTAAQAEPLPSSFSMDQPMIQQPSYFQEQPPIVQNMPPPADMMAASYGAAYYQQPPPQQQQYFPMQYGAQPDFVTPDDGRNPSNRRKKKKGGANTGQQSSNPEQAQQDVQLTVDNSQAALEQYYNMYYQQQHFGAVQQPYPQMMPPPPVPQQPDQQAHQQKQQQSEQEGK